MVIVDEADEILKFINAKTMKQLFVSSSLPAPRYSQYSCPDSCSQCILISFRYCHPRYAHLIKCLYIYIFLPHTVNLGHIHCKDILFQNIRLKMYIIFIPEEKFKVNGFLHSYT